MSSITIEGGHPLVGEVLVSGSKNSAIKILYSSLFSNEDIVIENIPRVGSVLEVIDLIKEVGGVVEWTGNNRLMINGSQIKSYQVPLEIGSRFKTGIYLAAPLLFRFGKAFIPKYKNSEDDEIPLNRIIETWGSLGVIVEEDADNWMLFGDNMKSSSVSFKIPSHKATDIAIMTSIFLTGETVITNASEESEIEDLILFLNKMGADIERTDPKRIVIKGTNIFKGAHMEIQPDKIEAATFAAAAVVTKGNIVIKGIDRQVMVPFVNFLNKIGAKFEFTDNDLKVWRHEDNLESANITVAPTPGFVPDWQMLAALMFTQANGKSMIHDTVYVDRFDYIKDLNRMGADIDLVKPSSLGVVPVISDDSHEFSSRGEPKSLAIIKGPTKLKGERIQIADFEFGAVLVLGTLCAEGKSEIIGIQNIEDNIENFVGKLESLGAKIWKPEA